MQQQDQLLTDRKLARCSFPGLPQRLYQQPSKSCTRPVNPRTFEALEEWPNFSSRASAVSDRMDDIIPSRPNLALVWSEGLDAPSDEISIRGALEQILFPQVNYLAGKLGLTLRYKSGGSGRSFSYADMVILDISQGQQLNNLSARVFGNGEAKGDWHWELGSLAFEQALNSMTKQQMCIEGLQQLFGDMILDECVVGFTSSYNETVFFYRESGRSKKLFYSPTIKITDAPVEKFLFVLEFAEQRKHLKLLLSRTLVKETPRNGCTCQLPHVQYVTTRGRGGKRKANNTSQAKAKRKKRRGNVAGSVIEFYNEERLCDIPAYALEDLHVNGNVLGMGKYGNVLEAEVDGKRLALKTYDLRKGDFALQSFMTEQQAYHHLRSLQGKIIPSLLVVGRLPHTSVLFLGLTDEGSKMALKKLLHGRRAQEAGRTILTALDEFHNAGVLHGDISLSHVLITAFGCAKFIDFDCSVIGATASDLNHETMVMEDLIFKEMEATT